MIETVLTAALVISNLGWLLFLYHKDKLDRNERWQIHEYYRRPEREYEPPTRLMGTRPIDDGTSQEFEVPDEFDVVGTINPELPLRQGNE